MDLHRKVLGPEHPDTLTSMVNLAATFSNQGKYEEAEELELKVLGVHKKLLGPEHPHTLDSMMNLARTYSAQEKYEEAEKLQMEIQAI